MENTYFLIKNYMYEYKDGRVVRKSLKKENGLYTSTIFFKDIINHTFKLPADLEKEDLLIKAEENLYNEAPIYLEDEYKINYHFKKFDDYYIVDAFAVKVELLKKKFASFLKEVKYIDFISPAFFVFEEYYNIKENITPKNDIFIYFTKEDAFMVGFRDKEFVFVKSLDKFSKLLNFINLKEEDLIKILKEKGLNKDLYGSDAFFDQIDSFFSQFFIKVVNIINYSKNFYHINSFDNIYFYSDMKINNIFEYYSSFWSLSGINFTKFEISSDYDPFEYCATIYNAKHFNLEDVNFSIFLRPPRFYQTQSGQFIIFSFFILLLILGDGLYKYMMINKQKANIIKLQKEVLQKEKKVKFMQKYINEYTKEIKKEKTTLANIETQINDISAKINSLYKIKKQIPLFNEIGEIINFTTKNDLKITNFEKNKNNFKITITSNIDNSSLIPKLLKILLKKGYKNVSSKRIINNKNGYITVIKYSYE